MMLSAGRAKPAPMAEVRRLRRENRIGPEHVLVLYRSDDADSVEIATYYQQQRGIPDANMLGVAITWDPATTGYDVATSEAYRALQAVITRLEQGDCLAVTLAGRWPTRLIGMSQTTILDDVLRFAWTMWLDSSDHAAGDLLPDLPGGGGPMWPQVYGLEYPPAAQDMSESSLTHGFSETEYPIEFRVSAADNRYKHVERDKYYPVGTYVYFYDWPAWGDTQVNGFYSVALRCVKAGTTGSDIPDFSYQSIDPYGPVIVDGDCYWFADTTPTDKSLSPISPTVGWPRPVCRPIVDRVPLLAKYANGNGIAGSDTRRFRTLAVTRLWAGTIEASDTYNGDSVSATKRIIDDSIWAEEQGWTDLPGNVFLSGTTTGGYYVSLSAYWDLYGLGADMDKVYWETMSQEAGAYGLAEPDPAERLYGGFRWHPGYETGDMNIPDVFMVSLGGQSYHKSNRPTTRNDLAYLPGAITAWAQSYGCRTHGHEIDYFHGYLELDPSLKTNGNEQDCYNWAGRDWYAVNAEGYAMKGCPRFGYYPTGPATQATVQYTAMNEITLRDDSSGTMQVTAVINVTPGTPHDVLQQIITGFPSEYWGVAAGDPPFEDRATRAIKNGASVAIGSAVEPFVSHGAGGNVWMAAMFDGACLAEALFMKRLRSAWTGTQDYLCIGDPLYRPFWMRQ